MPSVRAHARAGAGRPSDRAASSAGGYHRQRRLPRRDQAAIRRRHHRGRDSSAGDWTGFVPDDELRHLHSGGPWRCVLPSANEETWSTGRGARRLRHAGDCHHREPVARAARKAAGIFRPAGDEAALARRMRTMLCDERGTRRTMARVALASGRASFPGPARARAAPRRAAGGRRVTRAPLLLPHDASTRRTISAGTGSGFSAWRAGWSRQVTGLRWCTMSTRTTCRTRAPPEPAPQSSEPTWYQ